MYPAGSPSEKKQKSYRKGITGKGITAGSGHFTGKEQSMPQGSGTLRGRKPGESFLITKVLGQGALRQHFLDMGLLPGSRVTVMKYAPMGDPMEIQIHGYELTLRLADADKIEVREHMPGEAFTAEGQGTAGDGGTKPAGGPDTSKQNPSNETSKKIFHPGLGEEGKYHDKSS
jgi:ferrous iron transport protein B